MTPPTERSPFDRTNDRSDPADGSEEGPWGLLDASSQHYADPATFPIPTYSERANLHVGDHVKLVFVLDPPPPSGPNAERMWVEVASADPDGSYEGWLTNEPTVIPDLRASQRIAFQARHVAGIALATEDVSFEPALHAIVSAQALASPGPPGWVGYDTPVAEDDSGWSITAGDEDDGYFDGDRPETAQALTLGELVNRYPALVEVFQAGEGDWVYRPEHRRYVRVRDT